MAAIWSGVVDSAGRIGASRVRTPERPRPIPGACRQKPTMVPTAGWTNASGILAANMWTALQPEQ